MSRERLVAIVCLFVGLICMGAAGNVNDSIAGLFALVGLLLTIIGSIRLLRRRGRLVRYVVGPMLGLFVSVIVFAAFQHPEATARRAAQRDARDRAAAAAVDDASPQVVTTSTLAEQGLPFRLLDREEQRKGGTLNPTTPPRYLVLVVNAALTDEAPALNTSNVEATLRALLRSVRDEAIEQGKALDGVTAFLYQSVEHANGANVALGRAEWWPKGHSFDPKNAANIQNKSTYVETFEVLSLPAPPKEHAASRLPEPSRRAIHTALVQSEDRAEREAEARHPIDATKIPISQLRDYDWRTAMARNSEYADSLRQKYELELLQKFKITKAELEAVKIEAFEQRWPLPPSP